MENIKVYTDPENVKVFLSFDGKEAPAGFYYYGESKDPASACSIGFTYVLLEKDLLYSSPGAAKIAKEAFVNMSEVSEHLILYSFAKAVAEGLAKDVKEMANG